MKPGQGDCGVQPEGEAPVYRPAVVAERRRGLLLCDFRQWLRLLNLSFLIYEMGITAVPASEGVCANEIRVPVKHLAQSEM